ncbi:MAG: flagellar hook-basal body protein [Oscillospiraceae bacterium]|nr:flagellar hook-basal body protein [Oscillospiraceae bacterium]
MANAGFHAAASGVMGYQSALDITANNMANVNTNGFKASRASFQDILYHRWTQNERVDRGHGMRIDKTDLMFEQSAIRETGLMLDFAALDEGFFAVENNGRILYTKDGSFGLTRADDDGEWELCDQSGGFVLDYNGDRITVPFIGDSSEIDGVALLDMVGVYSFENPYGLNQIGNNYFEQTPSSGEAAADPELAKRQGFLESSSTSIGGEMSRMIEHQRAFQLNAAMVKTHGEIGDVINNLRN